MAPGEEGDEQLLDHVGLPHDGGGDVLTQVGVGLLELVEGG